MNTQGCRRRKSEGSRHLISVWHSALSRVFPCPRFYWEMVEALQWYSVMEGIKEGNRLWWISPWHCLQRWKSANCIECSEPEHTCTAKFSWGLSKAPSLMTDNKTGLDHKREVGIAACKKPTEPSHWQNGKQANCCQGLGKLMIFYFLLLYPWFPATSIPLVHLVNVVFSFDVSALFFFFNALTQCFQMEMCVAFLKNLGKTFFPNFLGEDKPVKPVLNGNFMKPGTLLCFTTSGRKVTAMQLWVIIRKGLSCAIWEK